ncbi:MAG TPA: AAA family ATPase [Candidatus Binatia bacterium]|nr:AAA family ATPase [Candidatus Binatia bacterium]
MKTPKARLARMPDQAAVFGPFRLDPGSGQLKRGSEVLHLRPKSWELLCLLVANPGVLLSKEEILAEIWEDAVVGDTMPSISVAELRRALRDDARHPAYIETVHGRGFRFVGALAAATKARPSPDVAQESTEAGAAAAPFVGRRGELASLEALASQSDPGCRIALVSGEAGIGKTTLVEQFANLMQIEGARSQRPYLFGRGQCLAHFGRGYPYLPVLGALQTMSQARADVLPLLRAVAPSWLSRLPSLMTAEDGQELRSRTAAASPGTIVEEMLALLRGLGPVVWILEDLHWADEATLELIEMAAENFALTEFRLIGTLRLAEAVADARGIARTRRELKRRGRCREFVLDGLTESDVAQFLAERFPGMAYPLWLAGRLLAHTNGNPFFLVQTVNHLIAAGVLPLATNWSPTHEADLGRALDSIPETLRELVQEDIAALAEDERRVLGAASLAGLEMDAATVALALDAPVTDVDVTCTELARKSALLVRLGDSDWPNGIVSGRYGFGHALYQKVLYEDQAPSARRAAHCRIGEGLAAAFGERAVEIAAILADHFERGGDAGRAVSQHRMAARDSSRRHASRDAAFHLRRALALLPGSADLQVQEGAILRELGTVLPALQGFRDPDLTALYMRARTLQAAGADASGELMSMAGLLLANLMQRRPQPAEDIARELLEMTATRADAGNRAYAEMLMGAVLYHRGDLPGTIDHAQRSIDVAPPGLTLGPIDHACSALSMGGAALWQAGRPDDGLANALHALAKARNADPFNLVITLQPLAAIHHWRGDAAALEAVCAELARCVAEQGIIQAQACADLLVAWVLMEAGQDDAAANKAKDGLAALRTHGTMMQSVYLITVAVDVFVAAGRAMQALALLDEAAALIEEGAARWWEPELYRWRAVVLNVADGHGARQEIETSLQRSLDLATEQGSRSLRLRTAMTMAEVGRPGRGKRESRQRIETALQAIRGGETTRDVRRARAMLA